MQYFPFIWKRGDTYMGIEIEMTKYLAKRLNFK
jgi:hypothetical protein